LTFPSNQDAHAAAHNVLGSCHDQPGIIAANAIRPLQLPSACIDPQYLNIPGPPYGGYNPASDTYGDFSNTSLAMENTQAVNNQERPVSETSYFGLINLALSATDTGEDPNVNNILEGYFNMVIDSPFFGYPGDANPQLNDHHHDFNYSQVDDEELGDIQKEPGHSQDSEHSQGPQYSQDPEYSQEPKHDHETEHDQDADHDQNADHDQELEHNLEPEHNQQAPEDKGEDKAPQPAATATATVLPNTARQRLLYDARHAAGRCMYCNKVNPNPIRKGCPDCAARRRSLLRAWCMKRKEARRLRNLAERQNGDV
jgi:hypothetical protein